MAGTMAVREVRTDEGIRIVTHPLRFKVSESWWHVGLQGVVVLLHWFMHALV